MQILSKVIKLDLTYASEISQCYQRKTCYLAPYKSEQAEHFARRILAYLSYFEWEPVLSSLDNAGKSPDLYVSDELDHIRLWCTVDLLSEKHLQRASHRADVVVLFLVDSDQQKLQHQLKHVYNNLRIDYLPQQQLLVFCDMLKGHMHLDLWREDGNLLITDGKHILELEVSSQFPSSH